MQESELQYDIVPIYSQEEKRNIMCLCDVAFEKSVVKSKGFEDTFQKIHKYADFLVAKGKEYMGYVAFYANDAQTKQAYISLICTHPSYKRMRVGYTMLKSAQELAKSKGMKTIKLEVYIYNTNAISFYEKNGFQKCGETDRGSMYMIKTI